MEVITMMIAGIFVFFLLLLALCLYYNTTLAKEYYQVPKEEIPDNFNGKKIVLLSDLHNHQFGKNNIRLIQAIEEEKPDYIMIAGDLIVKRKKIALEAMVSLLSKLLQIAPVYYAPGNHEDIHQREVAYEPEYKQFIEEIKNIGVIYLDDSCSIVEQDGQCVYVYGLHLEKEYFGKCYEKTVLAKETLEQKLGKPSGQYNILIAHNPIYFHVYAEWGADLVLSGHVHGGVIVLPFLGGVISTSYELFPKYDFGKFSLGKATMVLSRGLAMHTIKLRMFNKPEISIIQLGEGKTCEKKKLLVE